MGQRNEDNQKPIDPKVLSRNVTNCKNNNGEKKTQKWNVIVNLSGMNFSNMDNHVPRAASQHEERGLITFQPFEAMFIAKYFIYRIIITFMYCLEFLFHTFPSS